MTQSIPIYPEVSWIAGPEPDLEKQNFAVYVHGYNVNPDQAFEANAELYKRLWWSGYRGNYVGITWEGDEVDPLRHYCADKISPLCAAVFMPNVKNAFQTSPRVRSFLQQVVLGEWGADPDDVHLVAHSLGNLVALDALRLHSVDHPGGTEPLVGRMISLEAAVWVETFAPQASFTYDTERGLEYSVDDLKRNSWAFWFNQTGSRVSDAAGTLVNSYVLLDEALRAMRFNEVFATFGMDFAFDPRLEFGSGRGVPSRYRVPIDDGLWVFDPENRPDLWFEIPPLLVTDVGIGENPHLDDLTRPLGTMINVQPGAINIDAVDHGWREQKHSDFLERRLPLIWPWYQQFFEQPRLELGGESILPSGEE